jgi:peptide/nickel transport system substrate-binding protein
MILRKSRYIILVARELSRKYTMPLVFGFLLGVTGMIAFRRYAARIALQLAAPTQYIGVVGDTTPATIPLSIQRLVSGGLSRLGPDGMPHPDLATKWEATDSGKTYVFTIADNALWHSGKKVEARDVNYTIRDVTFTVDSPYAIRATIKEPFAPFLTLVSKPILLSGLKGYGPYRVDSVRLKGEAVQAIRLEPVSREVSSVAREYRFYRTERAAVTAFELGDVDILEDLSSADSFIGWKNASISANTRYDRVIALYFNMKDHLLGEKGVRQALGMSVPELGFERAYSPIAKPSWAYSDSVKKYSYDISQAKKLLAGAKAASVSGTLVVTTFSQYVDIAQKIASSWTDLGIPTSVQIVNQVEPFQVLLSAAVIPPDPDQYTLWHSTQTATNLTGYVNVKVDKLLEDGRREQDISKRKKIYADFAKRLVEDAPAIFLYYPTNYTVTRMK